MYWTVGTGPRSGAILAKYCPSPETKSRLTTDFGVMPVLNQYRFQFWNDTDVQYRASTDGQLLAKLHFGAVPLVGRAYANIMPVLQILQRYWRGALPVVNSELGRSTAGTQVDPLNKKYYYLAISCTVKNILHIMRVNTVNIQVLYGIKSLRLVSTSKNVFSFIPYS